MNKKGQVEMADLAGFLLIFIAVIVFGFVFVYLSPKGKIEVYFEEDNYLARQELIRYLSHEENGKNMADMVVLAVEEDNLDDLVKKSEELLEEKNYNLKIYKDGELLKQIEYGGLVQSEPFAIYLENFYDTNIHIEMQEMKVI